MHNFGKETTVQAHGRSWKLARLDLGVIRGFRDWVREQLGDYGAVAERFIDKLPADKAMQLVKDVSEVEKQLRGFTLQCPIAQQYLATESGAAKLVHLLLVKHQPEATEDDAFAIVVELGQEELRKKLEEAKGEVPGGNAGAPA